jgi:uncharacterized RDD family membrane protein YckC
VVGRRALARLLDLGFPVLAIWAGAPPLVVILLYWLYETLLTARGGQTLGKRLAAIRIVVADSTTPDFGRSAVRALPILVLALPFAWVLAPLAYLWALQADGRGLHDLAAGTRVVTERWIVGDQLNR